MVTQDILPVLGRANVAAVFCLIVGGKMSWISSILSGTPDEAQLIQATARTLLYYISPALFLLLYFVLPSPYGKLATPTWNKLLGPSIPARWAWFWFELPNLLWAAATTWNHMQIHPSTGREEESLACNYILFGVFVIHYIRRALLYPMQLSPRASPSSLGVVLNAMAYTTVNG